jgi:hypothetical protein
MNTIVDTTYLRQSGWYYCPRHPEAFMKRKFVIRFTQDPEIFEVGERFSHDEEYPMSNTELIQSPHRLERYLEENKIRKIEIYRDIPNRRENVKEIAINIDQKDSIESNPCLETVKKIIGLEYFPKDATRVLMIVSYFEGETPMEKHFDFPLDNSKAIIGTAGRIIECD